MASRMAVCGPDEILVSGIVFKKEDFEPKCTLEEVIPKTAFVREVSGGKLFAVPCRIGKDEHPFPALCEAARFSDGAWIVGIDEEQNRYFTPIFGR